MHCNRLSTKINMVVDEAGLHIRLSIAAGQASDRWLRLLYSPTYKGHISGISAEASSPTDRFSGMPTLRKSVKRYPPGPYTIMLV